MGSHSQSSWRERIGDYRFTVLLASLLLLVLAPLVVSDQRSVVFRAGLFVVLLFGVLSVLDHRRARVVMVALGSWRVCPRRPLSCTDWNFFRSCVSD